MNIRKMLFLFFILQITACGGSDSEPEPEPGKTYIISGGSNKGPIANATITAYTANREELGSTNSDINGRFSLTITKSLYEGIVIIESSGGSYTDEATGSSNIAAPTLSTAKQINGNNDVVMSLTPLTEIAYQLANQDDDLSDIQKFNKDIALQFGLGAIDIGTVLPANLSLITATHDAQGYYGTVLSILSQLQKDDGNLSTATEVIDAIKEDLMENNGILVSMEASLESAANNLNSNPNVLTDPIITNFISASFSGNLVFVNSIFLEQTTILEVGALKQLNVQVFPPNASDQSIFWSSSDSDIVVVGNDGGLAKGVKAGTATITATTANNKTAEVIVTVNAESTNGDTVPPSNQAAHISIDLENTEQYGPGVELSSLFSDDISSPENMEYRIDNYPSVADGFGISIGKNGDNSAYYAKADSRPEGNRIFVNPQVGFLGTAIIRLSARDEAGNESSPLQFRLTITAPRIEQERPNLLDQSDTLVIQEETFTPIVFSNTGGGSITSCSSSVSLRSGLSLTITEDEKSCQITGSTTSSFEINYIITAENIQGTSSAEITLLSQTEAEDADNDGLTNGQELANNLDPLNSADADANNDGDQLTNREEIHLEMDLSIANDGIGNNSEADKFIFHIANRLSYGAHSNLIQELNSTGVDAWINEQLDNPNTTLDADVSQIKRENVRQAFTSDLRGANIVAAARAVHSNYPLQTVMGDFWDNHFSTLFSAAGIGPHELLEQDYFYLNSLGNFGELLEYSAKSRTMSTYLNGNTNTKNKANENYAREVMELHTLGIHPDGFQAYDAQTIKTASKIFTGWNYTNSGTTSIYKWYDGDFDDAEKPPTPRAIFTFDFDSSDHNDGLEDYDGDGDLDGDKNLSLKELNGNLVEHTIISRSGNAGVEEGEEFLGILATHPATAKFICIKLARKFISDNPLTTTINNCSQTFLQSTSSDDQIVQVLKTLFNSAEFRNPTSFSNKIKDDQEYIISLYRLLELDATDGNIGTGMSRSRTAGYQLFSSSGQLFFNHDAPTGYPEISAEWNDTMKQSHRLHASNTIISSSWSQSLNNYFTNKGITNAAGVVRNIVPIMTAGNYQQAHLKIAHDILFENGSEFSMQEDRLRVLLSVFSQLPKYHLQ